VTDCEVTETCNLAVLLGSSPNVGARSLGSIQLLKACSSAQSGESIKRDDVFWAQEPSMLRLHVFIACVVLVFRPDFNYSVRNAKMFLDSYVSIILDMGHQSLCSTNDTNGKSIEIVVFWDFLNSFY
jgi:hypothetical protein